ncbi:hypothetical protein JCM10207_006236 [Rhodosporidiobolus poonsookiae]
MHRNPPTRGPKVDREKTCPSLLRVRDTTLRELLLLLRDASPSLRLSSGPTARYSLRLVYYDPDRSRFSSTDLAVVPAQDLHSPPSAGQGQGRLDRTLADAKFVVGDFLDVAFLGAPGTGPLPPAGGPPGAPAHGGAQYAPPPHLRGGPPLPGGGPPRGSPAAFAGRRDDTWAPPPGPGAGRGGFAPRGRGGFGGPGGGYGGGRPAPADQGWGRRRPSEGGERERNGGGARPPPPRRRDSRSRSPARGHQDRDRDLPYGREGGRNGGRDSRDADVEMRN